jgi:hypothetical protein
MKSRELLATEAADFLADSEALSYLAKEPQAGLGRPD